MAALWFPPPGCRRARRPASTPGPPRSRRAEAAATLWLPPCRHCFTAAGKRTRLNTCSAACSWNLVPSPCPCTCAMTPGAPFAPAAIAPPSRPALLAQAADVAHRLGEGVQSAVEYVKERLSEVHVERQGGWAGFLVFAAFCCTSAGPTCYWRSCWRRLATAVFQPSPRPALPNVPPSPACLPDAQTPPPRSARARRCWTRRWPWPRGRRRPSARRRAR